MIYARGKELIYFQLPEIYCTQHIFDKPRVKPGIGEDRATYNPASLIFSDNVSRANSFFTFQLC